VWDRSAPPRVPPSRLDFLFVFFFLRVHPLESSAPVHFLFFIKVQSRFSPSCCHRGPRFKAPGLSSSCTVSYHWIGVDFVPGGVRPNAPAISRFWLEFIQPENRCIFCHCSDLCAWFLKLPVAFVVCAQSSILFWIVGGCFGLAPARDGVIN
jgi:hypothetical protein